MQFIRHPKTRYEMANEIKRVCDQYWANSISDTEFKELILHYKTNVSEILFGDPIGKQINPTIEIKIGVKRLNLIKKVLNGMF